MAHHQPVVATLVLWLALGYLCGSLPFAYLVARGWGIDLAQTGDGIISAGNLWRSIGWRQGIIAGAPEIVKGILPVLLARWTGAPEGTEWVAAVGAVAGHNWPFFLRFDGGRGVGLTVATLAILFPAGGALVLGSGLLTRLVRHDSAPGILLGMLALFPFALVAGPSPVASAACAVLLLFLASRRLTGRRRERRPPPASRSELILNRLVFDRSAR